MKIEKIVHSATLASDARLAQKAESSKHASISEDAVFLDPDADQERSEPDHQGFSKEQITEQFPAEHQVLSAETSAKAGHSIHLVA